LIYGLGAALGWGFADLGAALAGRRIGSHATVVVSHVVGSFAFFTLFAITGPAWNVSGGQVALLAFNGLMAAIAYLLLYRALQLGPVALVSPIVAAYAAVTITLAVVLLGESLAGFVLVGTIVTIVGVILTATDLRDLFAGRRGTERSGVPFALLSMAMFGVATFILGRSSQEIGWMSATAISRASSAMILLGTAAARRRSFVGAQRKVVGLAAVVGLADILGVCLYTKGVEAGLISIVSAASATFTLIPVAGGIAFLRERPAASQALGVVLVVGGLLMLGLGN
jgi:uncharacterized membrane protein